MFGYKIKVGNYSLFLKIIIYCWLKSIHIYNLEVEFLVGFIFRTDYIRMLFILQDLNIEIQREK